MGFKAWFNSFVSAGNSDIDSRLEEDREHAAVINSQVIPCTPEVYAEWLSVYVAGGGKITKFVDKFSSNRYSMPKGDILKVSALHRLKTDSIVIPKAKGDMDDHILKNHNNHYDFYGFIGEHALTNEGYVTECSPDIVELMDMPKRSHWKGLERQIDDYVAAVKLDFVESITRGLAEDFGKPDEPPYVIDEKCMSELLNPDADTPEGFTHKFKDTIMSVVNRRLAFETLSTLNEIQAAQKCRTAIYTHLKG